MESADQAKQVRIMLLKKCIIPASTICPFFLFEQLFEKLQKPTDSSYLKTFVTIRIEYLPKILELVKKYKDIDSDVLILHADKDTVLNRYKLTRHAHPLQASGIT